MTGLPHPDPARAPFRVRLLAVASRIALGAALAAAALSLLAHWGVNARGLGAHDLGMALGLSVLAAVGLVGTTYAAPVLLLLAALSFFVDRLSALRFLLAGAVCAAPLALLSWLS